MPSQHARNPLSVRLPADEQARLEQYAKRTGRSVGSVVTEAVRQLLDREDAERRAD